MSFITVLVLIVVSTLSGQFLFVDVVFCDRPIYCYQDPSGNELYRYRGYEGIKVSGVSDSQSNRSGS